MKHCARMRKVRQSRHLSPFRYIYLPFNYSYLQ
uniref:Uncharacterized protein n=1 Tax=Anguilla anguilla TaxID=7936 RepID=A0A0E9T389_ANGAN